MSLIPYFQVTGYCLDHWVNQEVSRVTRADINHVGFRITLGDRQFETYVSLKPSDTLVKVPVLQKVIGDPVYVSYPHFGQRDYKWVEEIMKVTDTYRKPGVFSSYFHHYLGRSLGMQAPNTCTDLAWRCCKIAGLELKERFYPNQFIKEFILCTS